MSERLIVLDSKHSAKCEDFTIEFKKPIEIGDHTQLSLKEMSMWVSWHNIDEKFDNNHFKYSPDDGKSWITVTIDNGNYTLRELNNFLIRYFGVPDSPILFGIDSATSRFVIKLKENYQIDLNHGKLYEILGFEAKIYNDLEQRGKFIANISRNIDDIHIHCDIISEVQYNDYTSDVLYSFTPSNPPGSLIKISEPNPIYASVNRRNSIDRMRMTITDQDNNIIDLNNQRVVYRLLLKHNK